MKKVIFGALLLLISSSAFSQEKQDTAWKKGGNFSLQFTQAAYNNWQAGGVNSISGNGLIKTFANYDKGGKWTWNNDLLMGYGLSYLDTLFTKTDDRLELTSRVDHKISDKWAMSSMFNFKTQFTNGYQNPGEKEDSLRISTIFAPAYSMLGIGFTYKPTKKLAAYISPLTAKLTIVNDDTLSAAGAFGVEPGETMRWEVGGYANITYKTDVAKNVKLESKLELFSNYLDGQASHVDVFGELLLFMKVNKYITANFSFNVAYDHDIKFDTNDDGIIDGPRTQTKEVLGVGFSYDFGHKPKK